MSKIYISRDYQQYTSGDNIDLQTWRRDQIDNLVADVVDAPRNFGGFAITQSGVSGLIVGAGRLYIANLDYHYDGDSDVTFDLTSGTVQLPGSQKRIISIIGWGTEDDIQPSPREWRTAVTDDQGNLTGQYNVQSRNLPLQRSRRANLGLRGGQEGASPAPPSIASNEVEIARVECGPTGIIAITMIEENRIETNKDLNNRATAVERELNTMRATVASLNSDIASLRAGIAGVPREAIVKMIIRDLARLKEIVGRPDDATAYGSSTFGTANEVDQKHAASMCVIDGTLGFAAASIREAPYAYANPNEPKMVKRGNWTMPVHTEEIVIDTMLGLT